jgi:hypothetical protein
VRRIPYGRNLGFLDLFHPTLKKKKEKLGLFRAATVTTKNSIAYTFIFLQFSSAISVLESITASDHQGVF